MKNKIIVFIFLISANLLRAQETYVFPIDSVPSSGIELKDFWKFHAGDDSLWANYNFDDSSWDTINTENLDSTNFKGIGWFRLHLIFDSSLISQPLSIGILQASASEIYVNGKKLITFGKVNSDASKEERNYPNLLPVALNIIPDKEYVLAIRYSNHKVGFNRNSDYGKGFMVFIFPANEQIMSNHKYNVGIITISSIFFSGFIIALGIAHLFIFFFYRANKSNLYYFFFATFLSLYSLSPFFQSSVSNASFYDGFDNLESVLFPIFLLTLIILLHSIFYERFQKILLFITIFSSVTFIFLCLFFQWKFTNILFISSFILSIIEVLRVLIIALIKKKEGSLVIGTGCSIFILIIAGILLYRLFTQNGDFSDPLFFLLLYFGVLSIPVCMSLYLAKQFATTNLSLTKKLVEVETLSAKNMEQEKEKQKILETQKETLEIQVSERTLEIVEQKKVIEEKNRDITDSIDYAKTIQEAILPSKELKQQLFKDSFILFKPKDIVSGDFYWFAEKDGKKLIAACDCTGHGVPGALMSMIGNNILNQIVNEKAITSPAEILNNLHKEMRKTLKQEEQDETKDGMDIALITFNTETEIEFAGAQRPLWIIRKIDNGELTMDNGANQQLINNNQQLTEIKGNKFGIGGMQLETERIFTNHKVSISKDDCIYIFSDGYADQFSDINKKLMTSRFKELLISIQQKSMSKQEVFLNDFIENWRGKRIQIDDILVIGIRI